MLPVILHPMTGDSVFLRWTPLGTPELPGGAQIPPEPHLLHTNEQKTGAEVVSAHRTN